jgi:uncharacterized glyoxalase superfamily protein PhnB
LASAGGLNRMAIPSGTEAVRAFIPAMDFNSSKAFYEALGFKILLDGDVTIFGVGDSAFILQRYYKKEWAENCMMQMMVDDLDAWWKRIETLNLPKSFGVRPPKPPAIQPWGLRVGYVWDPSGVLWHVAQRRKNTPAD